MFQVDHRTAVVDHETPGAHSLLTGDLICYPCTGICLVKAPEADQAINCNVKIQVDDDRSLKVLPTGFDKQRDIEDHDVVEFSLFLDPSEDFGLNRRVNDCSKISEGILVVEDDRCDRCTVEFAIRTDYRRTEPLDHCLKDRCAGTLELFDDGVGIHHDCATVSEARRDR